MVGPDDPVCRMKTYVINLARRADRMAMMTAQLAALGLVFERIDAVDAQTVSDDVLAPNWPALPKDRRLTRGAVCCFMSHRRAWERFLATDEPWASIIEDDARLHPDASHFLSDDAWIQAQSMLIKTEVNFQRRSAKILIGKDRNVGHGYAVAPLLSKHMGAADVNPPPERAYPPP